MAHTICRVILSVPGPTFVRGVLLLSSWETIQQKEAILLTHLSHSVEPLESSSPLGIHATLGDESSPKKPEWVGHPEQQ